MHSCNILDSIPLCLTVRIYATSLEHLFHMGSNMSKRRVCGLGLNEGVALHLVLISQIVGYLIAIILSDFLASLQ